MLKGCDDVFDLINKLFGTQETVRKTDTHLLEELGLSRIEEGAARVEACGLFKPQIVVDFEKQER